MLQFREFILEVYIKVPKRGQINKTLLRGMFLNTLNIFTDPKGPKEKKIICTMDDVRGDFLGPPHGTMPAAVKANEVYTCIKFQITG